MTNKTFKEEVAKKTANEAHMKYLEKAHQGGEVSNHMTVIHYGFISTAVEEAVIEALDLYKQKILEALKENDICGYEEVKHIIENI